MAERLRANAAYTAWVASVERKLERYYGLKLSDIPDLPLRQGFEVGDTPAEFLAGTVSDYLGYGEVGE